MNLNFRNFRRGLLLAVALVASFAAAMPVEACPFLPFGPRARARRQDRQESRQSARQANAGCSGVGLLRTVLPPYGN
jgi:hypothetical protein